jgi:peptidoglycan/xylan/chitin deacetylase (PgdA/CDA1 family)
MIAVFLMITCPLAQAARPLDKAMISFTFDDGYASLYTLVRPILNKYKIPATVYIISDYVGQGWAVKWNQLWQLSQAYGWEIGNHTMNHPDLVGLGDPEVIAQIRGNHAALQSHGLLNVTAFAPPYGVYDDRVLALVKNDGSLYSSRRAWWDDVPTNDVNTFDQWQLIAFGMDDLTNPMNFTKVKPYIDNAIAGKKWLILMFHDVVTGFPADYQFNSNELNKIALYVYLKQSAINAVTVTRGVSKMLKYKSLSPLPVTTAASVKSSAPAVPATIAAPAKSLASGKSSAPAASTAPPANILIGR